MKVAVLGLGIIGSRAAGNLRQVPDLEVAAWNRSPGKVEDQAGSVGEAADGAEVVMLYLKDGPAVREVAGQIAAEQVDGFTLINHSTVDLATTRWLAELCRERGWGFLDAPFTGSKDASAAGALVYYVAGDPALVDRHEPLMRHTAKEVIRCGDTGRATILKLVTNLISACTVEALAESLAIAQRHGVDAEALRDAVANNACGSVLAGMKLPTMAAGDFDTHFSLANMLKDSRYVLDLAEGLETPAIRSVSERMAALCEAGRGDADYSVLVEPLLER